MNRLLTTCAPLCLLLPHMVMAQDLIELDEVILSATLQPQEVNRTGAIVNVVTDDDLSRAPLSVAPSLAREPGISFSSNGGLGTNTTLRIRGLNGSYIGVRIDGIDVTDPSSAQTSFNFGGLTRNGIGRIEVVKGSQSALYGSRAVAGVVDISTFSLGSDGRQSRLDAEVGSYGTVSGSYGYALRDGATQLSFNLSAVRSDGFSARSSDDEADGYEEEFLTFKGQTEIGDGIIVGGSFLYRDSAIEIDRSTTDPSGENFTTQSGARAFTLFDAFGIEHEFAISLFDSEREDPGGFNPRFNGDRTKLTYLGTTDLSFGTVTFGLDRTEETFDIVTADGESVTNSALGEFLLQPSETTDLALSLRYDDNDDFGGNLSGRAALAWRLRPDLIARGVIGNGFRAPSLFERFSGFGNPDLEVENSQSVEIGIERLWADSSIQATAFYIEIDNLIQFDGAATICGSGFGCYNQVPGTTVSQGLEFSGETALTDSLKLFGAYTYTDAKTEGERLARVPRHDLFVGLQQQFTDRLSADATLSVIADVVPSAFAPPDNKVGDYALVGLGAAYQVNEQSEAYFRVENLFDEDYETAGGFNMPGRSFFAGLRARF